MHQFRSWLRLDVMQSVSFIYLSFVISERLICQTLVSDKTAFLWCALERVVPIRNLVVKPFCLIEQMERKREKDEVMMELVLHLLLQCVTRLQGRG